VYTPFRIWDIDVSPDGDLIAIGGDHAEIRLIDANTGEIREDFQQYLQWTITDVAFVPDSSLLAFAFLPGVSFLDLNTGLERESFFVGEASHEATNAIVFSADGRLVATKSDSGYVRIWNIEAEKQIAIQQDKPIYSNSIALSPDASFLTAANDDGSILFWDTETGEQIAALLPRRASIRAIALSPEGTLLASGDADGSLCMWGIPSNETK
jgi:WD40 repeat protein